MPNVYSLSAEVHKPLKKGFRVKVSLLDLGMYINGMVVFPPDDTHDWAVYPPALGFAGKGKYVYVLEFNKKTSLWEEIFEACVDAVKIVLPVEEEAESKRKIKPSRKLDDVVTDVSDEPINLDDIPF